MANPRICTTCHVNAATDGRDACRSCHEQTQMGRLTMVELAVEIVWANDEARRHRVRCGAERVCARRSADILGVLLDEYQSRTKVNA